MRARIILVFKVLLVGTFVGVTVLSVLPTPQVDGLESDKLNHLIAYTVHTLLLVLSLPGDRRLPRGLWVALPSLLIYGAVIEVVQHYIGRQFDLMDMVANAVGVLLGAGAGLLARALR